MSNLDHRKRFNRFTSSQIYKLCGSLKNGKPTATFHSYIKEVNVARFLGRRTQTSVNTKATKWGVLMETVLFGKVDRKGNNYSMSLNKTISHPELGEFWGGTPDFIGLDKTAEIKCFEPLHFGKLVLALQTKNLEIIKKEEPAVYWQTVSNSIILGFEKAEIIAYMPYKFELLDTFKMIEETNFLERNNLNSSDYLYFNAENIEDFGYLPDDSKVSNINVFEFEIPKDDIELITNRVIEASKLLVNKNETVTNKHDL